MLWAPLWLFGLKDVMVCISTASSLKLPSKNATSIVLINFLFTVQFSKKLFDRKQERGLLVISIYHNNLTVDIDIKTFLMIPALPTYLFFFCVSFGFSFRLFQQFIWWSHINWVFPILCFMFPMFSSPRWRSRGAWCFSFPIIVSCPIIRSVHGKIKRIITWIKKRSK